MVPASFDEANAILEPPPGMTDEQCQVLSVLKANIDDEIPVVVSCWKCTAEELAEIQRTGRVWLSIIGTTMPPAYLSSSRPFYGESQ